MPVEEWAAQLVEGHAIEAVAAASRSRSMDVADRLTVVRHDLNNTEELPNVKKRVQGMAVVFMFQVPEDVHAIMETLAVIDPQAEIED